MKRHLIPSVFLIALMTVLPAYIQWVEVSGSTIHHGNLFSDYYYGIVTATVLLFVIALSPVAEHHKIPLLHIWLIKTMVVLMAMLLYEYRYGLSGGLDAFHYFDESHKGVFSLSAFEFGAGTPNIINLTRMYQLIMPDSYHAMKIIWAFIGLIAVYLIYISAEKILGQHRPAVLYMVALFPSILFWSSILGKDPVNLLGIALYIYGVIGFFVERRLIYIVPLVTGIIIATYIRIWYGPILTIPLLIALLFYPLNLHIKLPMLALSAAFMLLYISFFSEAFNLQNLAQFLAISETISQSWADRGGSGMVIEGGFGSPDDLLKFLPLGAFTALFRPLPGEVMNLFGLLAGMESLVLLVLFVLAIKRTAFSELANPVIIWAVSLVIVWASFYGIVSYQNLGSAVRFRLQILPVLLLLLSYLARRRV